MNSQGQTIDKELERQNFEYCGNALSEIWGDMKLDNYPVVAQYVKPEDSAVSEEDLERRDDIWFAKHVRTSQYFTEISKCDDLNCCSPKRSSLQYVLPGQFLEPPIPIVQGEDGLAVPVFKGSEKLSMKFPSLFVANSVRLKELLPKVVKSNYKQVPYDLYCSSVQKDLLERICKECHVYFASGVMLKTHIKEFHRNKVILGPKKIRPMRIAAQRQREMMAILVDDYNNEYAEWIDEDELDTQGVEIDLNDKESAEPSIISMEEHMKMPWVEIRKS